MWEKTTRTIFPSTFSFSESHKLHCLMGGGRGVKLEEQLWSPLMVSTWYHLRPLPLLPSPPRCSRAWWELKQAPWKEITLTLSAEVKEKHGEGKRRREQSGQRKTSHTPGSRTVEWHLFKLNWFLLEWASPVVHAAPIDCILLDRASVTLPIAFWVSALGVNGQFLPPPSWQRWILPTTTRLSQIRSERQSLTPNYVWL